MLIRYQQIAIFYHAVELKPSCYSVDVRAKVAKAHFHTLSLVLASIKERNYGILRGVFRRVRGRLSGPKRGPFGWKHPRAKIFWGKSLKNKEVEENEMGLSLKIVYSHPPFFFFFFLWFSFT